MDYPDCFASIGRTRWALRPHPLNPERQRSIDWSTLKLAGVGTKHQKAYLLKSAKELLCAYLKNARRSEVSPSTVPGVFVKIRRLIQWMVSRDIWRFGQLSEQDLIDYLAEISEGKQLTEETFQRYVTIFDAMWRLRGEYCGAMRTDPAFLSSQTFATFGLKKRRAWKAIDEAAALCLIHDALEWIEVTTPMVQPIIDKIWSTSRECIGLNKQQRAQLMNSVLRDIEQSNDYKKLRHYVGTEIKGIRPILRRLLALCEGAVAIVLLFLVGMRVSELLSLTIGSMRTQLHSDGHMYEYLSGVAAKKRGIQRLWIATPEVKAALRSIDTLLAGPRSAAKKNWLFISFSGTSVLPLPGHRLSRTCSQTIGKRLRLFANAEFRSDRPACGRLHAHAARKTFAHFVVLRDKRALGALAHHYGHVHRDYTDTNYIGHDLELAALLSEENRRDLANGLTDILKSSNLSGKGSKSLQKVGDEIGDLATFRGKKALARTVERLIDAGVTLAPCDWGYCVYVQSMSACGGDANGPNRVERSPDVCGGCANLVITEMHRSWWSARAQDSQEFLARDDINEQSRLVGRRRQAIAEKVLSTLNGSRNNLKEVCNDGESDSSS